MPNENVSKSVFESTVFQQLVYMQINENKLENFHASMFVWEII